MREYSLKHSNIQVNEDKDPDSSLDLSHTTKIRTRIQALGSAKILSEDIIAVREEASELSLAPPLQVKALQSGPFYSAWKTQETEPR